MESNAADPGLFDFGWTLTNTVRIIITSARDQKDTSCDNWTFFLSYQPNEAAARFGTS